MNTITKKRLDNLIPKAIKIVKEVGIAVKKDDQYTVSKTYSGYFSSFGADLVNTSPLATAIFCEDKSKEEGQSNSKEDRSLVAKAILNLMKEEKSGNFEGNINKALLSDYLLTFHGNIPNNVVYDMLAAAVALKIALRTFKKSE